jgi:hypothetical protein
MGPAMGAAIDKLVSISSPSLGMAGQALASRLLGHAGRLGSELARLLDRHNGFYAFESALHVFPVGQTFGATDLETRNATNGWRAAYGSLADGHLFFAEDLFGGQFSILGEKVVSFDPESGDTVDLADSIEGWAQRILDDYPYLTGHPLGHDWQMQHRPLPTGRRLIPKHFFVLGGDYEVENLREVDATEGMRLRGDVAVQIKDLPEGTRVRFLIPDDASSG